MYSIMHCIASSYYSHIHVDATSWNVYNVDAFSRCNDVNSTVYNRHVPAGYSYIIYALNVHPTHKK